MRSADSRKNSPPCSCEAETMPSLSEQLQDARSRAEVCLYSGGRVVEVRTGVMALANLPLPPCSKYRHIAAETMVIENSFGNNRKETLASLQRLSTALNILEKYGCNLTNPNRPKYWRTVKHNNPVFRATVDAIQGGRAVLYLYGYSNQQPDGLSFPDDVTDPDVGRVAAVTLEVMSLRMELEMLIKEAHPHPEFYERIIPTLRHKDVGLNTDAMVYTTNSSSGHSDSQTKSLALPLHHRSFKESRHGHSLTTNYQGLRSIQVFPTSSAKHPENCTICGLFRISAHCLTCLQGLCSECDRLYHLYPERASHRRTAVTASSKNKNSHRSSTWRCLHCTKVNSVQDVLCEQCERPRLESTSFKGDECQPATVSEWQCKSCTMVNAASSILCEVCERPRLATRPPVTPSHPPITPPRPPAPVLGMPGDPDSQWVCQFCTYLNYSPATVCEMCDLARPEPAPLPVKLRPPSPVRRVPALPIKRKEVVPADLDSWRQKLMKEEGLKLIQLIRDGEKKGVSPEEVYTSMRVAGDHSTLPCNWLKTELPLLLDQIRMLVATSSIQSVSDKTVTEHTTKSSEAPAEDAGKELDLTETESVQLSRAEAKQAWLIAGGDTERAARQALRDRLAKVKELFSLGFSDEAQCHDVLRQSGGEVRGALALLQRPLLESFHKCIWSDKPEPPIDINLPDRQGAPATFQRLMDYVLRDVTDFAAAYLDDVIVYSSCWEEHLYHLQEVLKRIRAAGLTINPRKCFVAHREVQYLGFTIGFGKIKPQVEKMDAIRSFPVPTTKRQVRGFIGLAGWYRKFVPNFSERTAVLTDLTKKAAPNKVHWSEECERAFKDLKDAICSEPVLHSPNFSQPFILQTDASRSGLGAVLIQEKEGERRPVVFLSRKLLDRETRYSTVKKECLAVKWAVDSLRYYLLGRHFVLETDHRALQWLHKMKDANNRITGWYLSLQPYDFTVRYRPGKSNVVADCLSRRNEDGDGGFALEREGEV
ncbi:E3 ubiquitin-protein ligase RNF31-like isoform X4 [Acanthochromis polyacanthus]|uniref:E3 ubiquitin-protein ligase RNF31-like isoform X4 n=1 Tax=Acanthochromis polyacanthus TaxID=80966 RepID=UPI0022346663|nr:E3 ubiquitin-protein ligase RNF31-like isoform X4 [Acanthochromis polyacanthus]